MRQTKKMLDDLNRCIMLKKLLLTSINIYVCNRLYIHLLWPEVKTESLKEFLLARANVSSSRRSDANVNKTLNDHH
jgi:hypothetical protein